MPENFPNFQDGPQFTGLHSLRDEMLAELERLREIMRGDYSLEEDEDYKNLSEDDRELFHDFLDFYGNCPICKSKNHDEALKKFYFSKEPKNTRIRDQLLDIMDAFNRDYVRIRNYSSYHSKSRIKLGIPCCNCFKKLFEEPGIIGFTM